MGLCSKRGTRVLRPLSIPKMVKMRRLRHGEEKWSLPCWDVNIACHLESDPAGTGGSGARIKVG